MVRNRQPELYSAAIITYTAAAVALLGRLIARRKTVRVLTWEDYLAMFAFFMGTGFTFISLFKMRWGLGLPIKDINMSEDLIYYHYFLDLWIDMWFYTFAIGSSKFVILGLYWRTFSLSVTRWPIRVLGAGSVCWFIVRIFLITLECQPIEKFWYQDLPGSCHIPPMVPLFASSIPHFALEVGILICPLYEISRLRIQPAQKCALGAMFGAGALVCCSALNSIVNCIKLNKMPNMDLTYDTIDDQIWAVCDVNIASIATSLPFLRPTLRSLNNALRKLTHGSSTTTAKTNTMHCENNTHTLVTVGSVPRKGRSRLPIDEEGSTAELSGEVYANDKEGSYQSIPIHTLECERSATKGHDTLQ
ncbi:hypothetical protein PTMSG1_08594 [Pyrenophora teres f. maculata]|nr:hypothetical protein PTMSG1_08594 [Pyrenophora teres f. maculata]